MWKEGECINESDLVEFEYSSYKCEVKRMGSPEPYSKEFCMFGGHLCGYIYLSKDHPDFCKHYDNINVYVQGVITYSNDECFCICFYR